MDELVGQLIWGFISSSEDVEAAERSIRKGRVGGVWLLPTEMPDPGAATELVNRLQSAAPQPLLVGVDAEAGMGLVMGGATLLPTAMAIGAAGDTALARAAGEVTAAEAGACGINAVAAPVLDVNVNPANPIINTRAFGHDPETVSRMGLAFMEGLHRGGQLGSPVLPIGKHFPGHGDTVSDSHLALGSVEQPRERLDAIELPPFRAVIGAGIPLLMTAHVAYPALDPSGAPATLSRPIMTELLREEMGFEGALVTDCMNMHAISRTFDPREAVVRAVQAGCDLILTDQWDLAYEAILHALLEDDLRGSRIREAAERVRAVKAQIFGPDLAPPSNVDPDSARAYVGDRRAAQVAERIAEGSLHFQTRGAGREATPKSLIMATLMARRFGPSVESQVRAALESEGLGDLEVMVLNPLPDPAEVNSALARAQEAGRVTLLHFNRVESFDPEAVGVSEELVSLVER